MYTLNILQQLQYIFHVLFTLKNKALIISLLQILFILLLTNLTDYTYCMTNESDDSSAISSICRVLESQSENSSEVSSVFEYDEEYIEQQVQPQLEHIRFKYSSEFESILETYMPEPIERALVPMFEDLKMHKIDDINTFDVKETSEKIKALQDVYFTERIKNEILEGCLNKQKDQLFRRHESLLESKEAIRELTQENLELKQYITQMEEQLAKMSQRK